MTETLTDTQLERQHAAALHLHRPIARLDHYGQTTEWHEQCATCVLPFPCSTYRALTETP